MKRLALLATLLATPAFAQQAPQPKPSQSFAGQLATALAQAQDRIVELETQLQAAQAAARPVPAIPPSVSEKLPPGPDNRDIVTKPARQLP